MNLSYIVLLFFKNRGTEAIKRHNSNKDGELRVPLQRGTNVGQKNVGTVGHLGRVGQQGHLGHMGQWDSYVGIRRIARKFRLFHGFRRLSD